MISRLYTNTLRKTVLVFVCIAITAGCASFESQGKAETDASVQQQPLNGDAKILQSWQGDYPTAQINLLPDSQRKNAVGFIGNTETFKAVWNAFKPDEAIPDIDFKANLVLFARNTQFFNRIRIGKVNVTNGVAELLAMSMVVIARQGITGI